MKNPINIDENQGLPHFMIPPYAITTCEFIDFPTKKKRRTHIMYGECGWFSQ